jgi:hypothetical protein
MMDTPLSEISLDAYVDAVVAAAEAKVPPRRARAKIRFVFMSSFQEPREGRLRKARGSEGGA